MEKHPILIYGASGFGREVAWLAESCGKEVICFIDDDPQKQGQKLNGLSVLSLEEARSHFSYFSVILGVGAPGLRGNLAMKAEKAGFSFAMLIHPSVEKSNWIEIEDGVVVCAGSILTTNIRLCRHVHINLDCSIGHDVVMGEFTTLAPGVHVSGWVYFGKRVYVGTGAVFINGSEEKHLYIGDDAVIGAGAVVTKSVPKGETWVGVPARPLHIKR